MGSKRDGTAGVSKPSGKSGEGRALTKRSKDRAPSVKDEGPLVVAIGASAGGLEAFSALLAGLPADTGMAFVLVQHLEPSHASNLAEILGRMTAMPVVQAAHGMRVAANSVYVIPPDTVMRIKNGALALGARPKVRAPSLTVDIFMTSLAEESGDRAIGVVLSGAASDGVQGLTAIMAARGITIVQDPATARYSGMPGSAVAAGVADVVLPVSEIGPELARLALHPYARPGATAEEHAGEAEEDVAFAAILERLRDTSGLDLRHYRRGTLRRRVERRMAVRHAESHSAYLRIMERDAGECAALFGEVLVRVTSFFRDPESFEVLARTAFPRMVRGAAAGAPVRVWVAGCATGQEAYSVAIALLEHMESSGASHPLQVFASDLREGDLEFARLGTYPATISAEVSAPRLKRFFTAVEGGYRVNKEVRECCVFARHDVTADPPFARLDLLTCRNLLIYMDSQLQRRVLTLFHYALRDGGTLFLGNSEGVGAAEDLFDRTPEKSVFRRLRVRTPGLSFGGRRGVPVAPTPQAAYHDEVMRGPDAIGGEWPRRLDELLIDRYAPAALLVDADLHVLQLRGDAGSFLRPRPGPASLDLVSMASEGLASAVQSAVAEASSTAMPARRTGLRVLLEGRHQAIDIVVIPLPVAEGEPAFAVLLGEALQVDPGDGATGAGDASELEYLRQELAATTDRLRLQTYRRDGANEELRAANEEIQSSNEELESVNEELETAKEELESTNEELTTLNDELQSRNRELRERNDDLGNLLTSVRIPIVMLDADLAIRRFTAPATELFALIAGDVGRSITDIRSRMTLPALEETLRSVLGGAVVDTEAQRDDGRWYRMSALPYRTEDGRIDGVVVSFMDIDDIHLYQEELATMWRFSEAVNRATAAFDEVRELGAGLRMAVKVAADALGADIASVWLGGDDEWSLAFQLPELPDVSFERARPVVHDAALSMARGPVYAEPVVRGRRSATAGVDPVRSRITVRVATPEGRSLAVIRFDYLAPHGDFAPVEIDFASKLGTVMALAFERSERMQLALDLAERNLGELRRTSGELEQASHVKDLFLANMSHELRTPLNSIIGFSTVLLEGMAGELNEEQQRQMEMVLTSGKHLLAIISDILDIEKIQAGAMPISVAEFDVAELVDSVVSLMRPLAEAKGVVLEQGISCDRTTAVSDELKVRQTLLNLVTNAVKYTDSGTIGVAIQCTDDTVTLVVSDTGRGMTSPELKRAFVEFARIGEEGIAGSEGTGLGLTIARRLCELLGGGLTAESRPGAGSTFRATFKRRLEG
jgi:two-component system CheB/CheR fusion protein